MIDMPDLRPSSIYLDGVSVTLQRNRVLEDVTITVEPGEILALLGPSGCGKTTMLRVIAGLQDVDNGQVFIDNRALNSVPPYRRGVGMVFQNYALFPHMTVADNIEFGLRMQGLSPTERAIRVNDAMEMLHLGAFRITYPARLSGGQQQRVAVARAIAAKPTVMLLDEPLSALDKKLKDAMRVELREVLKKVGITVIIVTHDQEEALSISDRVAVMNRGRIIQIGTGREIYDQPSSRFVADFVGHMNYMAGTVVDITGDVARVDIGDGNVVHAPTNGARLVGDRVEVAVRPELISVHDSQVPITGVGLNAISARLIGEEFLGIVSYLRFGTAYQPSLLVIRSGVGLLTQSSPSAPANFVLQWPVSATSIID